MLSFGCESYCWYDMGKKLLRCRRWQAAELAGWLHDTDQEDVCSFQDAAYTSTKLQISSRFICGIYTCACHGPVTGCMAIKSLHAEAGERKAKIWQKLLTICFLEHVHPKKQRLLNLKRQKKHNNKFINLDWIVFGFVCLFVYFLS